MNLEMEIQTEEDKAMKTIYSEEETELEKD